MSDIYAPRFDRGDHVRFKSNVGSDSVLKPWIDAFPFLRHKAGVVNSIKTDNAYTDGPWYDIEWPYPVPMRFINIARGNAFLEKVAKEF